ncbi:RES family NAD+ phosphorylase [Propionivibrio sp.]|uniref:RES family NAD+ phosphorylase n=1 Tax=Propionivibrio sp. TaxID=2212460 RepID=UPI003BF08FC2
MLAASRQVWRITTPRFVASAFSGDGARLYGGRWNRPGQSMVYTAESRSLALLEMLVQDDPLRARYVLIPTHLTDSVSIETIEASALPQDWRTLGARESLQALGAQWLLEARSCVLAVPSAVLPAEQNFLINPLHHDFRHIKPGTPEILDTDLRLLRNLVGES